MHFDIISSQETLNQLATVKGLSGLQAIVVNDSLSFPALETLEELKISNIKKIADLASIKTNLKRLEFVSADFNDIMPFIRESVEMRTIKIEYFFDCSIDLLKLNKEREKLQNAHKITMYVDERTYLDTKWAMKETNFGLIRLKRIDSFERNDVFF